MQKTEGVMTLCIRIMTKQNNQPTVTHTRTVKHPHAQYKQKFWKIDTDIHCYVTVMCIGCLMTLLGHTKRIQIVIYMMRKPKNVKE